ncbi:penicillin-binding transpeptidase domain-containing protein [Streptomyces sp. NRRL B-24484]|uniref:penicillin-binding transpeptidase domain-containing protein n=1 Tax=Streptomyces sp. NRRL B-24484 TaxID=1463833 RepID=UPI0006947A50|nr:penicillin-binding transpeptidase domain-containing protein [Streptomyces sp. NRRL B-24484]
MIEFDDDRYEEAEYGDAEYEDVDDGAAVPRRRRRAVRIGIAVVCAGMLTVGGLGAYNVASAVWGGSGGHGGSGGGGGGGAAGPTQPAAATRVPTADQAATAAKGFLDAWGKGDFAAAAALTDRQDIATGALSDFQQQLHPREFTLAPTGPAPTAGRPGGTTVGFHARLRFEGTDRAWEYDGRLGVVRTGEGRIAVHWEPAVIHPGLAGGGTIAVQTVDALPGRLVDRNGKPFDDSSPVKAMLAGVRTGKDASGTPGRAVVIVRGATQPAEQLFALTDPGAAEFRVTLDAELQRVTEAALREQTAGGRAGSAVVVEPSTGHVLAVANAGTFDRAFGGGIAPGSTMKVVTGAALLEAGLRPDGPAPCKDTANSPKAWHNDERGDHLGYTLADDFAHSCNTAFIEQGLAKLRPGTLAQVASEQFGLGLEWHTGLHSFDARIPAPGSRDEQAAEYIGQGGIQMNTLLMASVAATVQSGTFRQPVVVDGVADRANAPRRLPAGVARDLRSMMAKTVREGTARTPMAGLTGQVGAKTGTAEVDGKNPNSWFIAYRGDLAVAVEVEGAGHGADAAGRAAAEILRTGNGG